MKIKEKFASELDPQEIPTDWWLERFRNWRASELLATDFTQLPDSKTDSAKWAVYRQALRDLPQAKDFANSDLPLRPE